MPKTTMHSSTLLARLADIAHDARIHLQESQRVVSETVQTGTVTSKQLERLQTLDAATQEVEAVETVLEAVSAQLAAGNDPVWLLKGLIKDVRLSHVVDHLKGVMATELTDKGDDVTFF